MKFIKKAFAVFLSVAALHLYGCVGLVEKFYPEDSSGAEQSAFVPVDVEEGNSYFKDFDGNVITMNKAPDKVVSLSEISTEIICGIGAGRYIAAMNEGSKKVDNAPISAVVLPDYESDTEKIIQIAPDIAFYSDSALSGIAVAELRAAGITVIRIPERGRISDAEANIRFISSIMFKDAAGERVITQMRSELEKLRVTAELVGNKKTVYIESVFQNYAVGGDSIISEICAIAGGENIFADRTGYFSISISELKQKSPDVILILSNDAENYPVDSLKRREGYSEIYAVRTKSVYAIDSATATRPTQNITKAIKSVGEALKLTK